MNLIIFSPSHENLEKAYNLIQKFPEYTYFGITSTPIVNNLDSLLEGTKTIWKVDLNFDTKLNYHRGNGETLAFVKDLGKTVQKLTMESDKNGYYYFVKSRTGSVRILESEQDLYLFMADSLTGSNLDDLFL